jgi:hypothetical protein
VYGESAHHLQGCCRNLADSDSKLEEGGGSLAVGRMIAGLKRSGNRLWRWHPPTFRTTAVVVSGAVLLGTLLLGGGDSGRDLIRSLFATRSGGRDSYICAVVVCPLRMTVDPTTVRLNDSHSVQGHLQVLSDAPQPVILTYSIVDACTRELVPTSDLQLVYDENSFRAGSGSRGFTIRAPHAPKGVYIVTLTGLRGTVSWSTRLTVEIQGGYCPSHAFG